ncbi:putative zinc finger MYND domain-containing protein [Neospora caninum Liverpool]|uniref:Putative zinc finger MYND domain-containing protein n=1 Tax=Neospora caninum (strain Liverpool) TaxID=572307 RepID=F0VCA8_NEOCL|nr:putative zinc finger MYND domain-containing protein [Neospora caninum Liverpool]CBZ51242.1 putative zinc finger MYND domain-containing protein [Neospora caninum Liverpool]CEL68557.1 TPA: zinc finger MYND domain-containing protein,putative [Neospora caninum Liverpool]|eukprot:XP_003881275.1 putative zinc finger MYND domain-containing protein [Neospora caninum Liverpool]
MEEGRAASTAAARSSRSDAPKAVEELVSKNLEEISQFWRCLEREGLETQRRCKKVDSQDLLLQFLHQMPSASSTAVDEGGQASATPLPVPLAPFPRHPGTGSAADAKAEAAKDAEVGKERQSPGTETPPAEAEAMKNAGEPHWIPGWIPLLQDALGNWSGDANAPPESPTAPSSPPCRIEEASAALAAQHYQLVFSTVMLRDSSWLASAIDMIAEAVSLLPDGLLAKAVEDERRKRIGASPGDASRPALAPKTEASPPGRSKAGKKAHGTGGDGRRAEEEEKEEAKVEALGRLIETECLMIMDDYFVNHFEARLKADNVSSPVPPLALASARKSASPANPSASPSSASPSSASSSPSVVVTTGIAALPASKEKRLFRAVAHLYLLGVLCSSEHCVAISRSLNSHPRLLRSLPPLLLLCAKRGGFLAAAVCRALLHFAATGSGRPERHAAETRRSGTETPPAGEAANREEATASEKTHQEARVGQEAAVGSACEEAGSGAPSGSCAASDGAKQLGNGAESAETQGEAKGEGANGETQRKDLIDLYGDTIITFLHLCLREQAVDPRGINALGFFFLAPAVPLLLQTVRLRERIMAPGEKGNRHQQVLGWYLEVLLKALTDPQFRILASGNLQLARYVCEVVLELAASAEGCTLLQSEHAAWELIMTKSIRGNEPVDREQIATLCMWGTSSSEGGCAYCLRSDNTIRFLRLFQSPHAEDVPLSPEAQAEANHLKQLHQELQRDLADAEKGVALRKRRQREARAQGAARTDGGQEDVAEHDAGREMRLALSPYLQRARQELEKRRAARKKRADEAEREREKLRREQSEKKAWDAEPLTSRRNEIARLWQAARDSVRERDGADAAQAGEKVDEARGDSAGRALDLSPALVCALACVGVQAPWLMRAVQLGCARSHREGTGTPHAQTLDGMSRKKGSRGKGDSVRSKASQKKQKEKTGRGQGDGDAEPGEPPSPRSGDVVGSSTGEAAAERGREGNALEAEETKATREGGDGARVTRQPAAAAPQPTEDVPARSRNATDAGKAETSRSSSPSPTSVSSLPTAPSPSAPVLSQPSPSSAGAPSPSGSVSPSSAGAPSPSGSASPSDGGLHARRDAGGASLGGSQDAKLVLTPCPACGLVEYCCEECRVKDLPLHLFICTAANPTAGA